MLSIRSSTSRSANQNARCLIKSGHHHSLPPASVSVLHRALSSSASVFDIYRGSKYVPKTAPVAQDVFFNAVTNITHENSSQSASSPSKEPQAPASSIVMRPSSASSSNPYRRRSLLSSTATQVNIIHRLDYHVNPNYYYRNPSHHIPADAPCVSNTTVLLADQAQEAVEKALLGSESQVDNLTTTDDGKAVVKVGMNVKCPAPLSSLRAKLVPNLTALEDARTLQGGLRRRGGALRGIGSGATITTPRVTSQLRTDAKARRQGGLFASKSGSISSSLPQWSAKGIRRTALSEVFPFAQPAERSLTLPSPDSLIMATMKEPTEIHHPYSPLYISGQLDSQSRTSSSTLPVGVTSSLPSPNPDALTVSDMHTQTIRNVFREKISKALGSESNTSESSPTNHQGNGNNTSVETDPVTTQLNYGIVGRLLDQAARLFSDKLSSASTSIGPNPSVEEAKVLALKFAKLLDETKAIEALSDPSTHIVDQDALREVGALSASELSLRLGGADQGIPFVNRTVDGLHHNDSARDRATKDAEFKIAAILEKHAAATPAVLASVDSQLTYFMREAEGRAKRKKYDVKDERELVTLTSRAEAVLMTQMLVSRAGKDWAKSWGKKKGCLGRTILNTESIENFETDDAGNYARSYLPGGDLCLYNVKTEAEGKEQDTSKSISSPSSLGDPYLDRMLIDYPGYDYNYPCPQFLTPAPNQDIFKLYDVPVGGTALTGISPSGGDGNVLLDYKRELKRTLRVIMEELLARIPTAVSSSTSTIPITAKNATDAEARRTREYVTECIELVAEEADLKKDEGNLKFNRLDTKRIVDSREEQLFQEKLRMDREKEMGTKPSSMMSDKDRERQEQYEHEMRKSRLRNKFKSDKPSLKDTWNESMAQSVLAKERDSIKASETGGSTPTGDLIRSVLPVPGMLKTLKPGESRWASGITNTIPIVTSITCDNDIEVFLTAFERSRAHAWVYVYLFKFVLASAAVEQGVAKAVYRMSTNAIANTKVIIDGGDQLSTFKETQKAKADLADDPPVLLVDEVLQQLDKDKITDIMQKLNDGRELVTRFVYGQYLVNGVREHQRGVDLVKLCSKMISARHHETNLTKVHNIPKDHTNNDRYIYFTSTEILPNNIGLYQDDLIRILPPSLFTTLFPNPTSMEDPYIFPTFDASGNVRYHQVIDAVASMVNMTLGAYGGQSLKLPQEDASELARVALTPSDEILPSFHVVADTLNRFPQRKLVLDHEDILACVGRHLEERIQTLKRHLAPVKYHQLAMLQSSQVSTTSAIANNDDITTLDGLKRVAETRDEYTKSVMRKPSRMLDMSELILTRDDYSTMESITKPKEAFGSILKASSYRAEFASGAESFFYMCRDRSVHDHFYRLFDISNTAGARYSILTLHIWMFMFATRFRPFSERADYVKTIQQYLDEYAATMLKENHVIKARDLSFHSLLMKRKTVGFMTLLDKAMIALIDGDPELMYGALYRNIYLKGQAESPDLVIQFGPVSPLEGSLFTYKPVDKAHLNLLIQYITNTIHHYHSSNIEQFHSLLLGYQDLPLLPAPLSFEDLLGVLTDDEMMRYAPAVFNTPQYTKKDYVDAFVRPVQELIKKEN